MASQVQIPFEGVILQEHSAPISCPTPNFAKGSPDFRLRDRRSRHLWGIRDCESDPRQNEAHSCPVLRFLGVRPSVVPGISVDL